MTTYQSASIWVDADACPGVIREILFRAAQRRQITLTLVANHVIPVPRGPHIHFRQVPGGFDVADHVIAAGCQSGDLVVTQDIPLAAEVIAKGAVALSPRGELYTKANIGSRLNMRDFMDTMRSSGVQTGGPPTLGQKDRQQFANMLDSWLAKVPS